MSKRYPVRAKRPNLKSFLLATAAILVAGGHSSAAFAQQASSDVVDEVIVTGYDLGMNTAGGFGQYIRVPSAWLLKRPQGLALREAMMLGTAGLTAALCVAKLEQAGLTPEAGIVLVTVATGGVGSIAVALLASLSFIPAQWLLKSDSLQAMFQFGGYEVLAFLLLQLPLAAGLGAVLMAMAIRSKSF